MLLKKGYSIKGDVAFNEVAPKISYITPVPGGVGLMTIAGLLRNTLQAYRLRQPELIYRYNVINRAQGNTVNCAIIFIQVYFCKMVLTETMLPVMEAFYTLQGEGFYQGQAAYFIRLGGCDVGCFWCDVKESWDASPIRQ